MSKRNIVDLQTALHRVSAKSQPQPSANPETGRNRSSGKRGHMIAGFFSADVVAQLAQLGIDLRSRNEDERRVTQQELVREALNDLFEKYGKPRIA